MSARRPDGRYRLTDAEKTQVMAEMRAVLIDCARRRELITYSDLALAITCCAIHAHSFVFAHLLRAVCAAAEAAGDGMLCALVVSKATGMPSGGYFRRDNLPPDLDTSDLYAFWQSELEAVYARWAPAP